VDGYTAAWDVAQQYARAMIQSQQRAWQLEGFIYGALSMTMFVCFLVVMTYLVSVQVSMGDPNHWLLCRVAGVCLG